MEASQERHKTLASLFKTFKNSNKGSSNVDSKHFMSFLKKLYPSEDKELVITNEKCDIEAQTSNLLVPVSHIELDLTFERSIFHAKGTEGYSPADLKKMKTPLVPILKVLFDHAFKIQSFPKNLMRNQVFFIRKADNLDNPENYRCITIQNPFPKLLMRIIQIRLMNFLEGKNVLPPTQMGFRQRRITLSAAFTLSKIIKDRLAEKQKTFLAFIDFHKAFDGIKRSILVDKMRKENIPFEVCNLLNFIYNNSATYAKSSDGCSMASFLSRMGLP